MKIDEIRSFDVILQMDDYLDIPDDMILIGIAPHENHFGTHVVVWKHDGLHPIYATPIPPLRSDVLCKSFNQLLILFYSLEEMEIEL